MVRLLRSYRVLVLISLTAIAVSTLAVISNVPTSTPYSPFNTGARGTSRITELISNNLIYGFNELPEGFKGTVLLVLQAELPPSEYLRVERLLSSGAQVIILDEGGYSNNLLKHLGITSSITNYVVLDEVFKYVSREYPIITSASLKSELITYRPTYVEVSGLAKVVAESSKYSYADVDRNNYYSLGEYMRSYPIIIQSRIGDGYLTVISDLDVISNELIDMNYGALSKLITNPTYIAIGYLGLSSTDLLKYLLTKTLPTGYRSGVEGSLIPYVITVAVSAISYYLTYRHRTLKSVKRFKSYTIICSSYVAVIATYVAFITDNPYLVIPALANFTISLFNVGSVIRYVLTATLIYYSSLGLETLLYLIPTYLLIPYLMILEPDVGLNNFVGPSTTNLIKYLSLMLIVPLINLNTLLPLSLIMAVSIINCLVHYVRLYGVRVELLEVPEEVVLKGKASLLLNTYSRHTTYLALTGFSSGFFELKDYSIIRYDLPSNHLGTQNAVLNPVVMDSSCFAKRLLTPISVRYLVVPSTMKLIERLRSEVFSRRDVKDLLSGVELSFTELGSGLVGVGSEGISKVLSGLLVRGGVNVFLAELIRSLTALETEVFSDKLGSRGRLGEYVGVRPYIPGDEVRHIHWSKSLSAQKLMIKEFTVSDVKDYLTGGGGLEPAVMVDLTVSDAASLDRLILTLLNVYLSLIRVSPDVKAPLVIVSNEFVLVMKGKALDVLYRLYKALSNVMPKLIYDYEPMKTEVSVEYVKNLITYSDRFRYFSKLLNANKYFAEEVVRALVMNELTPPRPITILHSDVLSVRYGLVRYELSRYGYTDVELSKLAQHIANSGGRY
ncbi:MAG: DUF58 domain-containing protein [Sulfolobales archaeon]|nr:DUF58 domain-containing protein [Sulfolobales archaeon]